MDKLLDELQRDGLLPVLVFAFSRKDCERLAYQNQHRSLLDDDESRRMEALQEELVELFQLDRGELEGEVFQLARRGLGYHHAGMLPIHKEVVERMFTSGLLRMLFTTETFALGINMPARTVIFHSLRKFNGVDFDYMRTREYLQMAGRAGRQGIDQEGLVVSLLDDRGVREAPVDRLFRGKPEAVESRFRLTYSAILHLVGTLGREGVQEAWDKSFNQFQHRSRNKKARERNRRRQRRIVDAHIALLEDLAYLEAENGDGRDGEGPAPARTSDGERVAGESYRLTARGRIARLLHGYELQLTEMLFRGSLENLPSDALAVVFTALVWEERRRWDAPYVSERHFGGVRRHVNQVLASLSGREAEYGIPHPMKMPDWGLTEPVLAWCRGADFEELAQLSTATAGDICRTLRMTVQLMRQVRRAIDPDWDLHDRLHEAVERVNRDAVDARRQLELG